LRTQNPNARASIHSDVLVGRGYNKDNHLFWNDGAGSFTLATFAFVNSQPSYITLGDMDAVRQLVSSPPQTSSLTPGLLYACSRQTAPQPGPPCSPLTSMTSRLSSRQDGDLDVIVATDQENTNQLYFNNLGGSFTEADPDDPRSIRSTTGMTVAVADFNQDNILDMIVGHTYATLQTPNQLLLGRPTGDYEEDAASLVATSSSGDSLVRHVAVGDLDGDGDLDLLTSAWNNRGQLLINDGNDFQDGSLVYTPGMTYMSVLGDVDGDGDLDIVQQIYANARLLLNQGGAQGGTEGQFTVDTNNGALVQAGSQTGVGPGGLVIGDLDGDGDLDVAMAMGMLSPNKLVINQGGAQQGTEGEFVEDTSDDFYLDYPTTQCKALATGDIDGVRQLVSSPPQTSSLAPGSLRACSRHTVPQPGPPC
jgi:hypothetical protein